MPFGTTAVGRVLALLACLLGAVWLPGQETRPVESRPAESSARGDPEWTVWEVDAVVRGGLVYRSAYGPGKAAPLVLAFHGHGGSARQAARSFRLHEHWPEAIVGYLEGLPTPIRRIDPEGRRSGWQTHPGAQGDRDLRFVDVVLAALKRSHAVDEDRIYATGHSNGGTFTYLLWAKRPEMFAAFAPSAAGSWSVPTLAPKPAMHIAGEQDTLVSFENQRRTMMVVRLRNGCSGTPVEWAPGCLLHPSGKGAPFVSFVHSGGHEFPAEAAALIVRFFEEHPRPRPETRGSAK